ncbi:MAG: hypothetical protein Q9221_007647 [Calogaya cf. arnoldii]
MSQDHHDTQSFATAGGAEMPSNFLNVVMEDQQNPFFGAQASETSPGDFLTDQEMTMSMSHQTHPSFGARALDTSRGISLGDWQTLGGSSQVDNPMLTQDPSWTIEGPTLPSYGHPMAQGNPPDEPINHGLYSTFRRGSLYQPTITANPPITGNIDQPTENINGIRGMPEQESVPSMLQTHWTVGPYSSNMEDNTFTHPTWDYLSPDHAPGMINDTEDQSPIPRRQKPQGSKVTSHKRHKAPTSPPTRVEETHATYYVQISPDSWAPAIRHHEIRAELIAQAPSELYRYPPASGNDELDVTSYYEPHSNWGFNARDQRPDVCFQWLSRKGSTIDDPGYMKHRGFIVIDSFNEPIQDLPMPTCISSVIEAGRLEAMIRLHGHNVITMKAIHARMPKEVPGKPLKKLEDRLSMATMRFRMTACLPSTDPKDGSAAKKFAMVQCIPVAEMEEILVTNSTRSFRDLNQAEISYIKNATRGSRPTKEGPRELKPADRAKADAQAKKSVKGYIPINPNAEPFGEDIEDDETAINTARVRRGLHQIRPTYDNMMGTFEVQPQYNPKESVRQNATLSQAWSEDQEPPVSTPRAYHTSASVVRKRPRGKDHEIDGHNGRTPKSQRRPTDENTHGAKAVSRNFERASDPYMVEGVASRAIDNPYVGTGREPVNIAGISNPTRLSSANTSQRTPAIEEQPVSWTDFMNFQATTDSNWNNQLPLDHQTNNPITYGSGRKSTPMEPTGVPTHLSAPESRDYRSKTPENDAEARTIQFYFQNSFQEIRNLGLQPPVLPRGQSYDTQWQFLWEWYVSARPDDHPPRLWRCKEPWLNGWPKNAIGNCLMRRER